MLRLIGLGALIAAALPAQGLAAPPPNDAAAAAAAFAPYTAEDGTPREQQGVAELAEATPDAGVPRCLGSSSFARTVWYRVPEAPTPQTITVDASGRTLDLVDLAAFVQPAVPVATPAPTPTPVPPPARKSQTPLTLVPNACAGAGAGAADLAEEPSSAVSLRVPAGRPVLVQVGRRGPLVSADDDRAVLSLTTSASQLPSPAGDTADSAGLLRAKRDNFVDVSGATITEEDPAEPPCPSLGTVWRRFEPGGKGLKLISAYGPGATTLTVFSGSKPTDDNVLDCVNRESSGALQMVVPVRRHRTLWVRVGTTRPIQGDVVAVRVDDGSRATVIDGGPGGFDPTPGGPGGGFPAACDRANIALARVSGPRRTAAAGTFNVRRVPVALVVRGASVCDVELKLYGPKGHIYARGRAIRLVGKRTVQLGRLRTFKRGSYRLSVTGVDRLGDRVAVRGSVRWRLS